MQTPTHWEYYRYYWDFRKEYDENFPKMKFLGEQGFELVTSTPWIESDKFGNHGVVGEVLTFKRPKPQ